MTTWALFVKGDRGWEFSGFTEYDEQVVEFEESYRDSAFPYAAVMLEDIEQGGTE